VRNVTRGVCITNVAGRRNQVARTRFQATVEGGAKLARALTRLDDAVRVKASKGALLAAGGVIADDWQGRVPVLDADYRTSLEGAERAARTKFGASGSVAPRKMSGLPDDEQPFAYAARLEFGDADRAAEPSARPAFDASSNHAVEAAADVLATAAEGVTR
jgi:HK97 gp10 family phage protein